MPRLYIDVGGRRYTGPTLQSILEKNAGLKAMFSAKEMKGILQYAGKVAGERWIQVFLPMRFDPAYAKSLGYGTAKWYEDWKKDHENGYAVFHGASGSLAGKTTYVAAPQPTPYVLSGSSREAILSRARSEAVSVGGRLRIRVRFPLGNIAYTKAKSFTTVPAHEYARVVQEVDLVIRKSVRTAIESGSEVNPRILDTKSRGPIDVSVRPSWINERAAI